MGPAPTVSLHARAMRRCTRPPTLLFDHLRSQQPQRRSESNRWQKNQARQPHAARQRTVRSFVFARGRATAAQQRALDRIVAALRRRIRADASRPRSDVRPQLRRACSRSASALARRFSPSHRHPEIDCLGVEVHRPGVGHLLLGAQAAGLRNLRIICHDAVEVLQLQIARASISLAHIFFPDPWPKKRHHKRRLIQPPFIDLLARVLDQDGTLRLATDWEPYAQHMREVLDASAEFENVAADAGFVARSASAR